MNRGHNRILTCKKIQLVASIDRQSNLGALMRADLEKKSAQIQDIIAQLRRHL